MDAPVFHHDQSPSDTKYSESAHFPNGSFVLVAVDFLPIRWPLIDRLFAIERISAVRQLRARNNRHFEPSTNRLGILDDDDDDDVRDALAYHLIVVNLDLWLDNRIVLDKSAMFDGSWA